MALLISALATDPNQSDTNGGWPTPLAPEAFHGLAGEVVRMIEPHFEADEAALLMQFLVGFGNAVGRAPYYQVGADQHYVNLYGVLVGRVLKGKKGFKLERNTADHPGRGSRVVRQARDLGIVLR